LTRTAKEFASPIYWLANNNGRTFPACTILLIHHANKTGGFRGTTAIRDAVDEVWGLRYVEAQEGDGNPASVVDRVLQRVRAAYPRSVTRSELAADPLCGGSVAGITKATQRLVSRGLIWAAETRPSKGGGSPMPAYQALVSREKPINSCPTGAKTSEGLESTAGQPSDVSSCVQLSSTQVDNHLDKPTPCPAAIPSDTNGSAPVGQVLHVSPKETRSADELDQLMQEAARMWD
jgi:hypothetical protein